MTWKTFNQILLKMHIRYSKSIKSLESISIARFFSNQNQLKDKSDVHDSKLPYMGNLTHHIKNKLSKPCKEFCQESFNIKLVINSFKFKNRFSYKNIIANDLNSFLVYKFICTCFRSNYIGKICCHFKTRIEEYIKKDNNCHIVKHLHSTATWLLSS